MKLGLNLESSQEFLGMIVDELENKFNSIKDRDSNLAYYYDDYEELLGDVADLLSVLLEQLLKKNYPEWTRNKWIDGSRIRKIETKGNTVALWGVIIWSEGGNHGAWGTDPYCFEIELFKEGPLTNDFNFYFTDIYEPFISYEKFKNKSHYWDADAREWKYKFNNHSA